MSVNEGDILAGKYRVDKVLGIGGMGVVVAAHHIQLDDKVAIKFMLPEALGNGEAVARFAREARAAVRIKSEHVARVTDVGVLDSGAPYMVMEYLQGSDLSDWLKQRGQLPVEQVVEFILQASEAIAEAHALGIVHRDLKPANLFVIRGPDGMLCVKVLDFGISKLTGPGMSGSDMTSTSAVMGSPLYMSPEQVQSSKDVDARSDIWALGVILYELLTGESPFNGETLPQVLHKVMAMAPPPLRNRRPDVPAALEAVILKCLERDRGRRYPTIGGLAVALAEFGPKRSRASVERISGVLQAAGMSASALALPPSSDPAEEREIAAGTAAPWAKTAGIFPPSGRALGVVAAALALAVGGGWLLTRSPSEPTPEPVAGEGSAVSPSARGAAVTPAPAPQEPPALPVALAPAPVASAAALPSASAAPKPRGTLPNRRPPVLPKTPPPPPETKTPKSGLLLDER